jgi:hypothetical protein
MLKERPNTDPDANSEAASCADEDSDAEIDRDSSGYKVGSVGSLGQAIPVHVTRAAS